jgi:hypothetical protein
MKPSKVSGEPMLAVLAVWVGMGNVGDIGGDIGETVGIESREVEEHARRKIVMRGELEALTHGARGNIDWG